MNCTSSQNWFWSERPCSQMTQRHSVLLLRSVKARGFGELWREEWTLTLVLSSLTGQNQSFSAGQTGKMESDLNFPVNQMHTGAGRALPMRASEQPAAWLRVVAVVILVESLFKLARNVVQLPLQVFSLSLESYHFVSLLNVAFQQYWRESKKVNYYYFVQ